MKIIGLTGGIGSGKTTVAKMFKALKVPVYIADVEAKKILANSKIVRRRVIKLLGPNSFNEDRPDRKYIASKVFNDAALLSELNNIIHPKVSSHFKRWCKKQSAAYCIKEAAILFENTSYKNCDATILITAPQEFRIQRVMQRDTTSKEQVLARMKHQWGDEEKLQLATYHIENIDRETTSLQVLKIDALIKESSFY